MDSFPIVKQRHFGDTGSDCHVVDSIVVVLEDYTIQTDVFIVRGRISGISCSSDRLAATAMGSAKLSLSQPMGSPSFLMTSSTFALSRAHTKARVGETGQRISTGLGK
jgi:hypothetical protein